jgi:hypothetical protein
VVHRRHTVHRESPRTWPLPPPVQPLPAYGPVACPRAATGRPRPPAREPRTSTRHPAAARSGSTSPGADPAQCRPAPAGSRPRALGEPHRPAHLADPRHAAGRRRLRDPGHATTIRGPTVDAPRALPGSPPPGPPPGTTSTGTTSTGTSSTVRNSAGPDPGHRACAATPDTQRPTPQLRRPAGGPLHPTPPPQRTARRDRSRRRRRSRDGRCGSRDRGQLPRPAPARHRQGRRRRHQQHRARPGRHPRTGRRHRRPDTPDPASDSTAADRPACFRRSGSTAPRRCCSPRLRPISGHRTQAAARSPTPR